MQKFNLGYFVFPECIHGIIYGAVMRNKGTIAVYIDSSLTETEQAFALRHELSHIALNHLDAKYQGDGILIDSGFYISDAQEAEANEYAERMTDAELSELMKYAERNEHFDISPLELMADQGAAGLRVR